MMTKAFTKIVAGLNDATAYLDGDTSRGSVRLIDVVDVKRVRERTGLSQPKFSEAYGIPIGTLRNWEQGIRKPDEPARALLTIIYNNPQGALEALRA